MTDEETKFPDVDFEDIGIDLDAYSELYDDHSFALELGCDKSIQSSEDWDIISETNSEWDIVTNVQSVYSYDSFHFSYKDALLMKKNMASTLDTEPDQATFVTMRPAAPRTTCPVKEGAESDDDYFDAFFIHEGHKFARGGKASLMFNTNHRTCQLHPPKFHERSRRDDRRRDGRHQNRRILKATMN